MLIVFLISYGYSHEEDIKMDGAKQCRNINYTNKNFSCPNKASSVNDSSQKVAKISEKVYVLIDTFCWFPENS